MLREMPDRMVVVVRMTALGKADKTVRMDNPAIMAAMDKMDRVGRMAAVDKTDRVAITARMVIAEMVMETDNLAITAVPGRTAIPAAAGEPAPAARRMIM